MERGNHHQNKSWNMLEVKGVDETGAYLLLDPRIGKQLRTCNIHY